MVYRDIVPLNMVYRDIVPLNMVYFQFLIFLRYEQLYLFIKDNLSKNLFLVQLKKN